MAEPSRVAKASTVTHLRTEKTFGKNELDTEEQSDPWKYLMWLILKNRIFNMRISSLWKTSYPQLSAGDLANHLYDQKLGGDDDLLHMEDLVQTDQEAMGHQEDRDHGGGPCLVLGRWAHFKEKLADDYDSVRVARISVFDSHFVCLLEGFMILVVICSMIATPCTFMYDGRWSNPSRVPGGMQLLHFDLSMDVLYGMYLMCLLDMSYIHPNTRMEVVTSSKICRYHLRSPNYWIKAFSATVYLWIIAFDAPLWFNLVKLWRIGVFVYLPDSLWRLRDSSEIRLARPVVLLVCASHWCACLLFCFGGFFEAWQKCQVCSARDEVCAAECAARTTNFRGYQVSGEVSSYVVAMVEALYMLTGALDGPTGDGARDGHFGALIIVVLFAPLGQLFVSWFIASIVQETALSTALETRHSENRAFMTHALQNLNIPKDLQRRVLSMHYFQKMSRDHEALHILFNGKNLNSSLASALRIYLYKESVLLCPYLCGKDPNYIIEVIQVLKDVVCLPGDYVARRGEIANCMFFVARGRLGVVIPDLIEPANVMKAKKVKELRIPDFFGDIALIKDCVRTCWIRAETYVLLASLSRVDVEVVWKYFPEEREQLQQNVAKIAMEDKKRAAKKRWKNAFGEKRNELLAMKRDSVETTDADGGDRMGRKQSIRQRVLDDADGADDGDDDDGFGGNLVSGDSAALPSNMGSDSQEQLLSQVLQRQVELEKKVDMQQTMLAAALQALGVSAPLAVDDRAAASPASPGFGGSAAGGVGEATPPPRQASRRSIKKPKLVNKKAGSVATTAAAVTPSAQSPSSTLVPAAATADSGGALEAEQTGSDPAAVTSQKTSADVSGAEGQQARAAQEAELESTSSTL
eukprot:TRINITY_DN28942_c0_g1_i1.p1 TRINITY_DN28942_c0_g1~~TRINITY_DN28942_c0_g1_i1.p1  ORF type:complete len:864 (-),score=157.18 TRINITY_DN28942_c0_g1_i1:78-2669(-)